MAGLIEERFGVRPALTAGTTPGQFKVLVDDELVIKKRLPFVRPSDEKVLAAVGAALGGSSEAALV